MTRRDLTKTAMLGIGIGWRERAYSQEAPPARQTEPVTAYVADFIVNTRFSEVPPEVLELARKSILDGLGLALCGSVAKTGEIVRAYLKANGVSGGTATVIGSSLRGAPMKAAPRFAAFANAVGIHADDYDDTQLAVAQDRVYGLLDAPGRLPTYCQRRWLWQRAGRWRAEICLLAYNVGVEVECKIAEAIAPRHYEDGFHTTGTVGASAVGFWLRWRPSCMDSIARGCGPRSGSRRARRLGCGKTSAP